MRFVGRRGFISAVSGAVGSSFFHAIAVRAQANRMRRIGMLMSIAQDDREGQARAAAFEEGLGSLGWTNGRDLRIDWRWSAGDPTRMRSLAAELVAAKTDLIVANSPQVTTIVRQETSTIPIVFVQVADPLGSGLVTSLAKPGGNVTGFASFRPELGSKWLEILTEIVPGIAHVGVILDPQFSGYVALSKAIETAAPALGVVSTIAGVHNAAEIKDAIVRFAHEPNGGLIVLPSPVTAVDRELIVALAARYRLPAVYPYSYFTSSGGLVAYGVDSVDLYRRAAAYVDRILKGENPGDLPVQHPTKFDFVINLKAAKAIGLAVPPRLLARATEVIE
jgi:putative ABC transport system substrate-binding protein